MNDAQDLDHAVRCDPVDYQMPGASNPLLPNHETPSQTEMVGPNTCDPWNLMRARTGRIIAQGGKRGEHQLVVARGGIDAPLPGTFEEDSVDPLFCVTN